MYQSALEDYEKVVELDSTPAAEALGNFSSLALVLTVPETSPPLQANLEKARAAAAQSPHTVKAEQDWLVNAQREETKAAMMRRGCELM